MGRKRDEGSLAELLAIAPTWFGPVLAVAAFLLIRFVLPLLLRPNKAAGFDSNTALRSFLPGLAWIAGGVVLVAWVFAELTKLGDRRRLDRQTGADSIRDLSWQEFERLVAEAYRRKGYLAEILGGAGADGGIDIRLSGHGDTVLVQCKQWRAFKVGVVPVRELLGVVSSERATGGILVTSGRFTAEAKRFAAANPSIALVDGLALEALIAEVRKGAAGIAVAQLTVGPAAAPAEQPPLCPKCQQGMVLRTARQGTRAGEKFWGCPGYPACRGTRPIG